MTNPKPDPSLKGKEGGNCNRTACQKSGAWCKHHYGDFYCLQCALDINRLNRADSMALYSKPDLINIPENIEDLLTD